MIEQIRKIADEITDSVYYAALQEQRASGDVAVRSYWRGKRIQATADASALCDLIGDAEPDWEALTCLARSSGSGDGDRDAG